MEEDQQLQETTKEETQLPLLCESENLQDALGSDEIAESADDHVTELLKHNNAAFSDSDSSITSTQLVTDEESTDEGIVAEAVKLDCSANYAKSGAKSLNHVSSENEVQLAAESVKHDNTGIDAESVKHDDIRNNAGLVTGSVKRGKTANDQELAAESVKHYDAGIDTESGNKKTLPSSHSAATKGDITSTEHESIKLDKLSKKGKLAQQQKQKSIEAALKYKDIFITNLGDVPRFAYMSLCAMLLHQLFEDRYSCLLLKEDVPLVL
ncbi:hypothetical protein NP493_156g03063 [Ridgeia piscesae]|uniref:Uncharacterized protein n=1 Tax=Ridgeia piscesae TaxID=27915 RepID=A0AAD9P458_RIDPI|nr:hypothetical protein NP493_156g03063 [Ridgeia piscesae]